MTILSPPILFWIAAGLACVIALAFILPGLLRGRTPAGAARRTANVDIYRDQLRELETEHAQGRLDADAFAAARGELAARLAGDALDPAAPAETATPSRRGLGYALALAFPLAAFGLYFLLGTPAALTTAPVAAHPAGMAAGLDFATLVERVERRVEADPADAEAVLMLAKSYGVMQRWTDAVRAYEKAAALLPGDAAVLSGYAEALSMRDGGVLTDAAMSWVRRALAADPNDMKGLELAGFHALDGKDYPQAHTYFSRLYAQLPPELPYAQDIRSVREEAARLAGLTPEQAAAADAPGPAAAARITGRVDVAPALRAQLGADDVLFVFARAAAGGPPVAAIRARAGELPLDFTLDDATAMNPGNALSAHERVNLVARVSKSGGPAAAAGDLEGELRDVAVGARGVSLLIERIRP
jgi:cytochrome c-type biogenesis protein CcmH